jgi:hypothetical protein
MSEKAASGGKQKPERSILLLTEPALETGLSKQAPDGRDLLVSANK